MYKGVWAMKIIRVICFAKFLFLSGFFVFSSFAYSNEEITDCFSILESEGFNHSKFSPFEKVYSSVNVVIDNPEWIGWQPREKSEMLSKIIELTLIKNNRISNESGTLLIIIKNINQPIVATSILVDVKASFFIVNSNKSYKEHKGDFMGQGFALFNEKSFGPQRSELAIKRALCKAYYKFEINN